MTPHILVVEDDSDIQEYVRNLLTENGYTVTTTSTGTSALALINKTEPDLVVLDLHRKFAEKFQASTGLSKKTAINAISSYFKT